LVNSDSLGWRGARAARECADTLVACGPVAVADTKLSSAPRAAEKAKQQSLAAANGAAAHEPFASGVMGDSSRDAHRSSPEGVSAGVDRVGQNMMHGRVRRRFPDDPLGGVADCQNRQWNLLLPEPHEHLP